MTTQYIQNKKAHTHSHFKLQIISNYFLSKNLTDVVKIYWENTNKNKYAGWISV